MEQNIFLFCKAKCEWNPHSFIAGSIFSIRQETDILCSCKNRKQNLFSPTMNEKQQKSDYLQN